MEDKVPELLRALDAIFPKKRTEPTELSWNDTRSHVHNQVHFEDFKKCMLQHMTEDEFQFRCNLILHMIRLDSHINHYSSEFPGMRPEFLCFMGLPKNEVQVLVPIPESKNPHKNNNLKIIKFIKSLNTLKFGI